MIIYKYIMVGNVFGITCQQHLNTVYVYSYNNPTYTVVIITTPHCSDSVVMVITPVCCDSVAMVTIYNTPL